jgi:NAD(P)-dependent dehydrogenase (short-subunit alcohol dehydrogenase family)
MPKQELKHQTVLITGASRGIGQALALTLAKAGASLGLVARDEEALQQVASQIAALGGNARVMAADVSQPERVEAVVSKAQMALGHIDVLINAAGIQAPIGPFLDNDLDDWENTVRVNLFGPLRLTKAVLPLMMARGHGKIINFSGGGATGPRPNFSAYAVSKAALVRFTETLAVELKPHNIQVNAVAPGAVNTQMLDEIIAAGAQAGAEYEAGLERLAKGGTPVAVVCELVLFLASAASGKLTGKLISAPHDPWRQWQDRHDELNATPWYTLRRLDPFTIKPLIQHMEKA